MWYRGEKKKKKCEKDETLLSARAAKALAESTRPVCCPVNQGTMVKLEEA